MNFYRNNSKPIICRFSERWTTFSVLFCPFHSLLQLLDRCGHYEYQKELDEDLLKFLFLCCMEQITAYGFGT